MNAFDSSEARHGLSRRLLLQAGLAGAATLAMPAAAQSTVDLQLAGGNGVRPLTSDFPGKRDMILQRVRPPLLETPMEVFDQHDFTPNDRFFVRWHWAGIPTAVDVKTFRLSLSGHVEKPLSIDLGQILAMPRMEIAAINQCSGNSRGMFQPRIPGAQWRHGAMGNARWMGVSVRRLLDLAGVRAGAQVVRFSGLDDPLGDSPTKFAKSLNLDHARDGEVMIAFAMNGEQLPLLNGFPLRLIVPGWFSTYWVKALSTIEVLDRPDDGYWMTQAYKIPDRPFANVAPGETGYPTVPINRMTPRSFITNIGDTPVAYQPKLTLSGIAMGGDAAVARVDLSADGGRSWSPAKLGPDSGMYSFRRFYGDVALASRGTFALMARCTNAKGVTQPMTPNWNPGGFMRSCVETTTLVMI